MDNSAMQDGRRIAFVGPLALHVLEKLDHLPPGLDVSSVPSMDDLVEAALWADAIVTHDPPPDVADRLAHGLKNAENRLRWLQLVSAGYGNLYDAGMPASLIVTAQNGGSANAVAEHALALLLALSHRIPAAAANQQRKVWQSDDRPEILQLADQTVLIVGFGHIGKRFLDIVHPFGPRIIVASRSPVEDDRISRVYPIVDLHAALADADNIVLAIAGGRATHHLIDSAALAVMRPTATLINVARGSLIDQIALEAALSSGRLAGAGLDVTSPEPLPPQSTLWAAPNLLITPHLAGAGQQTWDNISRLVAANMGKWSNEKPLQGIISIR
jgi:phosphoglycerate dehydrogenase-like enzyme